MKCDYCNESIEVADNGGFVQLTIAGNHQNYHARPAVTDGLSCWQLMLLGWGHAIDVSNEHSEHHGYKPSRLRAVG